MILPLVALGLALGGVDAALPDDETESAKLIASITRRLYEELQR